MYQLASFPNCPVIAQWAHERSGHGDSEGGYAVAQLRGLLLINAGLAIAIAWGPICYSRDQPWVLHMTPVPGVISQLNGGRSILLDYVHHGRVIFCSYWNRHSRYGFVFPAHNASAQTTNCRLSKCFIHIMVFHPASLLIKEPTS